MTDQERKADDVPDDMEALREELERYRYALAMTEVELAAERERCARIAEQAVTDTDDPYCCVPLAHGIAKEIRNASLGG